MTNVCPEYKTLWRREFSAPNKVQTLWVRRECVPNRIFYSLATLHQMSYIECMKLQLYCERLHKHGNIFKNIGSNCYSYRIKQIYRIDMFHSEILTSLNVNKNKILFPGLENQHTLKCCSDNFQTSIFMSR